MSDKDDHERHEIRLEYQVPDEWADLPDEEIEKRLLAMRETLVQRFNAEMFAQGIEIDGQRTELNLVKVRQGRVGNLWDRLRRRKSKVKISKSK